MVGSVGSGAFVLSKARFLNRSVDRGEVEGVSNARAGGGGRVVGVATVTRSKTETSER